MLSCTRLAGLVMGLFFSCSRSRSVVALPANAQNCLANVALRKGRSACHSRKLNVANCDFKIIVNPSQEDGQPPPDPSPALRISYPRTAWGAKGQLSIVPFG